MRAVEDQIDFSDFEGAAAWTMETVRQAARGAAALIDNALLNASAADRLREGFVVVIAGRPNVGKSTLSSELKVRTLRNGFRSYTNGSKSIAARAHENGRAEQIETRAPVRSSLLMPSSS